MPQNKIDFAREYGEFIDATAGPTTTGVLDDNTPGDRPDPLLEEDESALDRAWAETADDTPPVNES